jgi:hypothetical protein
MTEKGWIVVSVEGELLSQKGRGRGGFAPLSSSSYCMLT